MTYIRRISGSRSWWRDRAGAAAVEMAIVLPLFLLFMLGVVETGRLFWYQVSLRQAVEQTARYAMAEYTRESFYNADFATWFNSWDTSLTSQAPSEIYAWSGDGITFTATTTAANATTNIDFVTIDATYTFTFLFTLAPGMSTVDLSATSRTPLVGYGTTYSS
jgi:Flp pilus assembly protein TadG